jgi:hypothetical protein
MDSQTAIDWSDLGPECPSDPCECRDSDGTRESVADWVQREVDECTALLMLGIVTPIAKAIDRVARENTRALAGVQQAVTLGLEGVIESNHETLEPLLGYIASLNATASAPAQMTPPLYTEPQRMRGGEIYGDGTEAQRPRQTSSAAIPQGGTSGQGPSQASSGQPQSGNTSYGSVTDNAIVQGGDSSSVVVGYHGVSSQAGVVATQRTQPTTSIDTLLDMVAQLQASEASLLSTLAVASEVDTNSPVSETGADLGPSGAMAPSPIIYQVWYNATGDPSVIVTTSDDTDSVLSLTGNGYTLVSSYSSAVGWTQSQVIDESMADVTEYLASQNTVAQGGATGPLGAAPAGTITSARREPPVDWWTQGTDWALGNWDAGVKARAKRYYGPAFASIQNAASIADAERVIDVQADGKARDPWVS